MTVKGIHRVGQVSPSQLMHTYGIGALADLPQISVIISGLDDWKPDPNIMRVVTEDRLLQLVRSVLGQQVKELLAPPAVPDLDESKIGAPTGIFPRWYLCPLCRTLAPIESGLFRFEENEWRLDRIRFVHQSCSKAKKRPPTVVPARFMVACEHGHLDDFPWDWFVHRGNSCGKPQLRLREFGPGGEARDLDVVCDNCKAVRRMSDAFGYENRNKMPVCSARRPHLRDYDADGCSLKMQPILLGASNLWFSVVHGTIAVPTKTDELAILVQDYWHKLKDVDDIGILSYLIKRNELGDLSSKEPGKIWAAINHRRDEQSEAENSGTNEPIDIRLPEWEVFSNPSAAPRSNDFRLRQVDVPNRYEALIDKVVLVERLREVRAMVGFTRIDSPGEMLSPEMGDEIPLVPLSKSPPKWVLASEVRGEGIFIQLREDAIQAWLSKPQVQEWDMEFHEGHTQWRRARKISDPDKRYPTLRYVLLHTLSHALMRQFSLDCGYPQASIRERIYSRSDTEENGPMAGLLIYTAAPDSEGTLGGLVSLGETESLDRGLSAALLSMQLCSSDPLCAEHRPSHGMPSIHAAACHACLFAPETSCERGNKYLDRSVLVKTLNNSNRNFFA